MNMQVDARSLGKAENADGLAARNQRLHSGDIVQVRVRRQDAGETCEPRYETFAVPYEQSMRILDALNYIAENQAPDLSYRWLCGTKMCGTCAVRMNGREVLACWEAVEPVMTIEPLRNLPVVRDIVVDRSPYEERVAKFEPWLERSEPYAGFPETLSHQEMKNASKALDCISCMSCFSACPVVGLGSLTDFAGPAPLVQLAQTALDPRNSPEKIARALEGAGIFNCLSCYKCEEVCPAKIPIVTHVIEPLKAKTAQLTPRLAKHGSVFRRIVAARGRIDPSELILRVQGLKALLGLGRALRLLARGKINPIRTFFGRKSASAKSASRILD
jgi:succinate dehydrogenase/fumarate reductase iron-sulfur protein